MMDDSDIDGPVSVSSLLLYRYFKSGHNFSQLFLNLLSTAPQNYLNILSTFARNIHNYHVNLVGQKVGVTPYLKESYA